MQLYDEKYREYRIRHQYDVTRDGFTRALCICPDIPIGKLQVLWEESVDETLKYFDKPYIIDCGIEGTGHQMNLFEKKVADYKKNLSR